MAIITELKWQVKDGNKVALISPDGKEVGYCDKREDGKWGWISSCRIGAQTVDRILSKLEDLNDSGSKKSDIDPDIE